MLYVILQIKIHKNHAAIHEEGETNFGEKYHTCIWNFFKRYIVYKIVIFVVKRLILDIQIQQWVGDSR